MIKKDYALVASSPFKKILDRAKSNVTEKIEQLFISSLVGDSPIEQIFFGALASEISTFATDFNFLLRADRGFPFDYSICDNFGRSDNPILIESQMVILDWPVDFVVKVQNSHGYQSLIIECDGHEFHERTKEHASRDRSRDRRLQEAGFTVFRFTGSEIWRDPIKVVTQVIEWAIKQQLV